MGLVSSSGGSANPSAVPSLLARHAPLLTRLVGTEPVAVGDRFWCARGRARRHARARALTTRLRRSELLAFDDRVAERLA